MRGAVIYHSRWGNCRRVAEMIAEGLRSAGHQVELLEVGTPGELDPSIDFLVVGSPTRIGKMTGPIKRFIRRKIKEEWRGKPFAAFGTGIKVSPKREEQDIKGAERIHDTLSSLGLKPVAPPFKALVAGMRGPLMEGEPERAREFGKNIGKALAG